MTKFFVSLYTRLADLREREEGQTFAEYALIIALVAVALIVVLSTVFRPAIESTLNDISAQL
jgi:Flp pilus assembly pilin Flp